MLEWLKRHAWKACKPLKGFAGSNPALSAINAENQQIIKQTPNFTPKNVKLGVFILFKKTAKCILHYSAVFMISNYLMESYLFINPVMDLVRKSIPSTQ